MPEVPALGARGGGWVVLQFALMAAAVVACVVGPAWPGSLRPWLGALGALLVVAGAALVVLSARTLGASLTPFPRPSGEALIVVHGAYSYVRHPIYLGGLVVFTGVSLAFSPWALAPTAALGIVWGLKVRVEERFLAARFPGYEHYCTRTRYRLVPYVY